MWPWLCNSLASGGGEVSLRAYLLADRVPGGLREVRDWWRASGEAGWLGWVLAAAGAAVLVCVVLQYWRTRDWRKTRAVKNDPDELFENLLGELELTASEKKLLREMAGGARLRHPSMCLLSPGVLAWARGLWAREQGPNVATAAKKAQIDAISIRLYDHVATMADRAVLVGSDAE